MAKNESSAHETESPRFAFGRNWKRFVPEITDTRIALAQDSLKSMLQVDDLRGRSFLDIGSGSGLFSLAAKMLQASRVFSFDYDQDSVACTRALREKFFAGDAGWKIEQGSVLDPVYMARFRNYDVVYSWGVLHHTGSMWTALANATLPVAEGGKLFVAIYNDQGYISTIWKQIKRTHCSGRAGNALVLATVLPVLIAARGARDLGSGKNPFSRYGAQYTRTSRGMSPLRDIFDWLGGYPFEVASADELSLFFQRRGFSLDRLKEASGSGCHELVVTRHALAPVAHGGGRPSLSLNGPGLGSGCPPAPCPAA